MKSRQYNVEELLEMARDEWHRGGNQAAERLLRRAAEKDETARSSLLLGDFLLETSFPEEAEKVFARLSEQNPANPDYIVRLARSLAGQERFASACSLVDRALEHDPLHKDALALLVEISGKMNTPCRTVRRLEYLSRAAGDSPEPHLALAAMYDKGGLPEEAERVLRRGLEYCPAEPILLDRLGTLHRLAGRAMEAVRCHENALEAFDQDLDEKDIGTVRSIRINLANALCDAGRVGKSLKLFERLAEEAPDDEQVVINMAIAFRRTGRKGEARRTLDGFLHRGAESWRLHYWLGITCVDEDEPHEAEQHFRRALALGSAMNSDDETCLKLNLASVLNDLGRPAEALPIAEDVLFLDPDNDDARLFKAEILVSLDRFGEAAGVYRTLLERRRNSPPLLHRLGMIEALAGRFDQAAQLLKRSISLTPRCRREDCLDTAEVLLLDGRDAECLDTLTEGLAAGSLTAGDIQSRPGLDDIKETRRYREAIGGSLLDFADPWSGSTEQRLVAVAAELAPTTSESRDESPLWRELFAQGTLVGDRQATVRHILKVLSGDLMASRSMNRFSEEEQVHFEVHPREGGLEIRSVFHGRDGDERDSDERDGDGCDGDTGTCTLSQLLFRARDNTYLLRFHER